MRTLQWAAEIAAQTQDPSAMDWFDVDTIVPELLDINGAPFRFVRDQKAVAALRQGRQQQQATEQLVQSLPGLAAIQKASTPEGNAAFSGQ